MRDVRLKNNEGTTLLKDMRQWWPNAGREMSPAAGPTRQATYIATREVLPD